MKRTMAELCANWVRSALVIMEHSYVTLGAEEAAITAISMAYGLCNSNEARFRELVEEGLYRWKWVQSRPEAQKEETAYFLNINPIIMWRKRDGL